MNDRFAKPHRSSHTALLVPPENDGVREVDAVVVPTARGATFLVPAARLAAELGAVLIALCSGATRAHEAATVLRSINGLRWHAVDVPPGFSHPTVSATATGRPGHGGRVSLSRKRNLALLVARMCGWETLLFLDDDIRSTDATTVRLAAAGLGRAAAVGFAVHGYPDNSVVCHARRLAGAPQAVFVGGSALLVDPGDDDLAHFPTVYNEDWLYLFDAVASRRVARTGTVEQVPYQPFVDPQRGADEEFGEVLAEGLVAHLEDGGTGVPLDAAYWSMFRWRRIAFLAETTEQLHALQTATPHRRTALTALAAARARLETIRPEECVRFLKEWRVDRDRWRRALHRAEHVDDVPTALRRLHLPRPCSSMGTGLRRPAAAPVLDAVEHPAASPRGTAVIVPGFLDGRRSPAHHRMAAALSRVGLSATTFDPRGTATRPDDILDAGPTTHLGDIRSLTTGAAALDGARVLVGHCYGAWLSCLQAASDETVTHLVAVMPTTFLLWPREFDVKRNPWPARSEWSFTAPVPGSGVQRAVRVSRTVLDDALKHDVHAALVLLAARAVPMLFLAGGADIVIPPDSVRALADTAGATAEFVQLPGVRHDYRDRRSQRVLVQETVVRWLVEQGAGAYSRDVETSAVG